MNSTNKGRMHGRAALGVLLLASGLGSVAAPARAQDAPVAQPPSDNAMVNLVRMLVVKGVLTQESADALIRQAEGEAAQARAATPAAQPGTQMAALATAPAGTVRVPYVPQIVRDQIKEEVKQEVIAEAREQHWVAPNVIPDWVNRVQWTGDFRFRDQFDLYSDNNTNDFIDYAAFNASGPIDINPTTNPSGVAQIPAVPLLNTRRDRLNQFRIRARLGLRAAVTEGIDVGVRLATGGDSSPVSTNQTLGGGLSKKAIWLDQAYVNLRPIDSTTLTLGRMPNPWLSTDLVYDDDLNFDGAALSFASKPASDQGLGLRAVAGIFPIEYGGNNFPANSDNKAGTDAKWLYGAQIEGDWKTDIFNWRLAAAYYGFHGVQGELSEPCPLYNGNKQCSTDQSRPSFMQKGNSLFLIRNILPNPASPLDYAQPQFVGLVSGFDLLDLTTQVDWKVNDTQHLVLQGDFVRNLAFDPDDACRYYPLGLPVTNVQAGANPTGDANPDPCGTPPSGAAKATFQSGGTGWMVRATYGSPRTLEPWQWNVTAGYKYLQPDAVLDAFTDSDFHLGGTNAKGYFLAAQLGIYRNTWITARWLSANAVYGAPLNIDVAQIDLNIGF